MIIYQSTNPKAYTIEKEFQLLSEQNIAFVIGEFPSYVLTTLGNGTVANGTVDAVGIMRACKKENYNCGYIAWCWNGNESYKKRDKDISTFYLYLRKQSETNEHVSLF